MRGKLLNVNSAGKQTLKSTLLLKVRDILHRKNISLICAVVEIDSLRQSYSIHFIESSYIHEKYNRSDSWVNDIALVKVTSIRRYDLHKLNDLKSTKFARI